MQVVVLEFFPINFLVLTVEEAKKNLENVIEGSPKA